MPELNGTPDNDDLYGTTDPDVINAGDGDDNIHGDGGDDQLYGEGGNDFIAGGEGDDLIDGGDGRDIVNYAEASDSVAVDLAAGTASGADGNDTLVNIEDILGSSYDDLLLGDGNANMIIGNAGNDEIYAGAGDDNVIGESGDDFLYGDDGSDHLLGGLGDDYMIGGDGSDTANYHAAAGSVTVDLYEGTATGADGNDTLFNIENILGSDGYGDVMSGDDNDNHIDGVGGNDTLRGFEGNDTLDGGAGGDFLNGGFGDDYIYGGEGSDRAAYYTANALFGGVTVSLLLQGQFQDTGAQGYDLLTGIENLSGTAFADTLIGDSGDNWLWGSAATISPGNISQDNNDYLDGGDGNDLLTVGIGAHTLFGGDGIDTVRFTENGSAETGVTISLGLQGGAQDTGNGSWTLSSIENLSGGTANDNLTGDGEANTLAGDLGNDIIDGGGGGDLLLGDGQIRVDEDNVITTFLDQGANGGNDTLNGGGGDDVIHAGAGADLAFGGDDSDTLFGGDGNDQLYGGSIINSLFQPQDGNDVLYGEGGNDVIRGGSGNDLLDGGDGDDNLRGDIGDDTMIGGDGRDFVSYRFDDAGVTSGVVFDASNFGSTAQFTMSDGRGGTDSLSDVEHLGITGSAFDDILIGSQFTTSVVTVNGLSTANTISGNGGNDQLLGGESSDQLDGGTGNDSLDAAGGDDFLFGGDGNDRLVGGDDNDFITGGNGTDYITGGFGDDVIDGGADRDRAGYYQTNAALGGATVSLLLQGTAQDTGTQGSDTLTGIENLSGTPFADTLIGDSGDNWLWGSPATISAGNISAANNDYLDGGDGNDLLTVGIGNHTLIGGDGIDTVRFTENGNPETGVVISLFDQGGPQDTGNGSWTLTGIENLSGGTADDSLEGNGQANTLAGDLGSDVLNGGGGNDLLLGDGFINVDTNGVITTFNDQGAQGGNDSLSGGGGDDTLYGGAGRDNLSGGGNNDTLYAGDGNDFLSGGFGDDYLDGGDGIDRASFFNSDPALGGVTVDLTITGQQNTGAAGIDTLTGIEQISGTMFADTLTGDGNDNWLWGSGSILNGVVSTSNNDTLSGGGGNDLLTVGIGDHVVDGGADSDSLSFNENEANSTAVVISLALAGPQVTGAGTWTLSGIENVSSAIGDDQLTGDDNVNVLGGSLGNDMLNGGGGDDALYGDGEYGIDNQGMGTGPVTFFADASSRYVGGFGGTDILDGGLGDDLLFGGSGTDTASYATASGGVQVFLYEAGSGEAFGAAGHDQLEGIENLTGSDYGDRLLGDDDDNVLDGGGDQDELRGFGGNDTILGGAGDDFIAGGFGDDILDGGDGYDRAGYFGQATSGVTVDLSIAGPQDTGMGWDTLVNIENVSGTAFADTLTGDDNDNWLWGSTGGFGSTANNDILSGGGGNDLLTVGYGVHSLSGGSGTDTVRYTENGGPEVDLTLSLAAQGGAQSTGAGDWTLTDIENLSGGLLNDLLTGDGNANVLAGDSGNDTLVGGDGNDTLYGDGRIATLTGSSGPIATHADVTALGWDSGNDLLEGGLGNDTLDGGAGTDTATYAHASGGVTVNLNGGFANGADGNDTLANIENVTASEFDDTLTGNSGANVIEGLGGNDTLQGHAGDDIIYGGDGNDTINGDLGELNTSVSGNDSIYGGDGNDVIRGGLGNDAMYGGANNDLMRGGGGVDYFDGGADDGEGFNGIGDRVSFFDQLATQGAVADLRTGVISNDGFGNVETMVGIESLGGDTAYADTFYGNDSRNLLGGNRGDSLYAFGGADSISLNSAAAVVDGGDGTDSLQLFSAGNWLTPDTNGDGLAEIVAAATTGWTVNLSAGTMVDGYGNSGAVTGIENIDGSHLGDTLTGDGNANVLNGFGGNDTLNGRGGNDTLDGGDGVDTATYANASGSVTVDLGLGTATGADGNDTLANIENVIGSGLADTLSGDGVGNQLDGLAGNDAIRGFGGNDALNGGDGGDILIGGAGDDTIAGGTGNDRVGYYHTTAALGGVTVSLAVLTAQNVGGGQDSDTISGVENVSGTPFADSLTGDDNDNWLWGSASWISAGNVSTTNNDTLNGGGGNDLLTVGIGNHTLIGGAGTDTVSFTENGGPEPGFTVSLVNQGRAQNTGAGSWTITGVENLSGGLGVDKFTGDDFNNVLAGNAGGDVITGGLGNDVLIGDGYIAVDANGVITTYYDGATGGNDTLNGGRGDDILYGGRGNDIMSGGSNVDWFVIQGNSGADRIIDFTVGTDIIAFNYAGGPDDFGDLLITKSGTNTLITWGTGDSLLLEGLRPTALTAASFHFGPPPAAAPASLAAQSFDSGWGGGLSANHFDPSVDYRADYLF